MLLAIMATEMTITGLFSYLFSDLESLPAGILDATLLTAVFAPPFWYALFKKNDPDDYCHGKISPNGLFFMLILAIFATEFLIMIVLPILLPDAPVALIKIVDSGMTTVVIAPLLWWMLFSRRMQNRMLLYEDFLQAPVRLLVLLLMSIFFTDLLIELLVPFAFPHISRHTYFVVDSVLSTLIISPLFWWLLIRPLMMISQKQKAIASAIYTQAKDAIITIDKNGFILTFNHSAEIIFGYKSESISGKDGSVLFLGDGEYLRDKIKQATNAEDPNNAIIATETVGLKKDGSEIVMEVSISRVLMEDKAEFLLILRDISKRKAMEHAIKESEERLTLVFNASNDAIWDWDIRTGEIYFGPRFTEVVGYSNDELKNNLTVLESLVHPTDLVRMRQTMKEHLISGTTYDIKYRMLTNVGIYHWFRARGKAVRDESGRAVRMVGSISDINTEQEALHSLRESEIRFRQIFEQSEDAIIFFKTGSCSIIDVNNTAEMLYGYTKAELQDSGIDLLCCEQDRDRLVSTVCNIRKGRPAQIEQITNRRKDGTEITVSVRGKIITLQGIDIIYCTFRDVSERLRIERKSRDLQAKLIQANKMTSLGLLVSGVAHEINNPNNFIMANTEFLEKTWEDAMKILREYSLENGDFIVGGIPFSQLESQSPRLFSGIIDGSRRINGIVNELKNFARNSVSTSRHDIIDVNKVVNSTVSILHYEINKFTINFNVNLAEDLPPIRGNSQQLGQVILNLLMNSCQALSSRTNGIWLTTACDSDHVNITVRDEGCGMSRENGKMIMEPFFTTKIDSGGTGLGLSICQSIIKEHSWTLEFASEINKGTTFVLKIPVNITSQTERAK